MKKIIPIVLILALAACSKNVSTDAGSWSLHNTTYKATQAYYIFGGLTAYTGTNNPTGSVALWFNYRDTTWPVKPGNYILTNVYPPDSGYVFMQITDSSLFNSYVITGSTTPLVTVARTSASDSLLIVTIPPVEVWNINGTPNNPNPPFNPDTFGKPSYTDRTMISGTIKQTR